MVKNSKHVGDVSEAAIAFGFLCAGITVLKPVGDNSRYDLAVDVRGKFFRIQCKTASYARAAGALTFQACSRNSQRSGGGKDYRGAADYFGVYSHALGSSYLIPVSDAGKSACRLRVDPTINGQELGVRWACDFEFSAMLKKLGWI